MWPFYCQTRSGVWGQLHRLNKSLGDDSQNTSGNTFAWMSNMGDSVKKKMTNRF